MYHPKNVCDEFYGNKEVAKTFLEWERGDRDDLRLKDGSVPKGVLPSGKTLFDVIDCSKSFDDGGTLVTRTEHFDVLIPGGFRDYETVNMMNPVKYSLGGMRALMSLAHLIAVPRKDSGVRICNAVTMGEIQHRWLISEMERALVKGLLILIDGGADMPGSIRWQLSQCGEVSLPDGRVESKQVISSDISPTCKDSFDGLLDGRIVDIINEAKNSIKFSFHLSDVCSIMHLHGHGYCGNLLTIAHDKMESEAKEKGQVKNTSTDIILSMISSGVVKKMKDDLMSE